MSGKQKLELTWIGKEKRPRLEPRILVEVPEKSYCAKERKGDNDQFENMLIHGDNLLALKALEQEYTGRIKCIYIDPPYNTGNAFDHYDDCLEHSIWLGLMRERLEILSKLLADDGVIFVQIDKREAAYLKVLMDEVFSRDAFVTTIVVRMSTTSGYKIKHSDKTIVKNAEYIHVYSRKLAIQPVYEKTEYDSHYSYILHPAGEIFKIEQLTDQQIVQKEFEKYKISCSSKNLPILFTLSPIFRQFVYDNKDAIGRTHTAPAEALQQKDELMRILPSTEHAVKITVASGDEYLIKKTATTLNQYIPIALKYQMVDSCNGYREELSNILGDWWDDFYYDMGNVENEGNVVFNASKKPERLIFRILNMCTAPGDIVLDSFLGSGTTAAVAHKMGRQWIGVELGNHCYTHCLPRLQKVIDGIDQSGISTFVDWHGGGGFRFFELGESLIQKDKWGQEIVNKKFNAEMLAQAVCKLEGFIYAPGKEEYFIHGYSTEHDFIFVTTNFMQAEYLKSISEQVGEKRSLLICCKGFEKASEFSNLTVKKIPKAVLDKCEWGHDDYSLNVANLPMSASIPVQAELFDDIEGDEK